MIGKIYYPAPYLSNDTMPYYKSAYDTDMRSVIDTYAAAQEHIDQSLAMTLFMRSTIPAGMYEWKNNRTDKMTTRDLNILRHYAYQKALNPSTIFGRLPMIKMRSVPTNAKAALSNLLESLKTKGAPLNNED